MNISYLYLICFKNKFFKKDKLNKKRQIKRPEITWVIIQISENFYRKK